MHQQQGRSDGDPPLSDCDSEDELAQDAVDYSESMKMFAREILELVATKACNETGASSLLSIVNKYYGEYLPQNLQIPYTYIQLQRIAEKPKSCTKLLDVCAHKDCHVYDTDDDRDSCPVCSHPRTSKRKRQMMLTDLPERLTRMMSVKELASAMRYPATREVGDGDVWDGQLMEGATIGDDTSLILHLGLCSDGYYIDIIYRYKMLNQLSSC